MNVYTKTKVLLKFGSFEIVCVEMRPKKLIKLSLNQYMQSLDVHAFTHMKAPYFVIRL